MYRAIKSVPPVDPSAFKASVIPIPYKNPPNNTFRTRSSKKGVKEKMFKKNDTIVLKQIYNIIMPPEYLT